MIATIKAEFRKLLTVRSAYIISALALVMMVFISFYAEGYKGGAEAVSGFRGPLFLAGSITQHSTILSVFGSLVALLLFTHEYRYNTITYTLSAANRRSKVLVAKIIVVFTYILCLVIVGGLLGLGCMILGERVAGQSVPAQDIALLTYFGKILFYCEAWALFALFLAALLRNQVAAFAVLLLGPNLGEGLLSLVIRDYAKYLPFNALQQVISTPTLPGIPMLSANSVSPVKGALIFLTYLVAGWVVAWILFLYRDAN